MTRGSFTKSGVFLSLFPIAFIAGAVVVLNQGCESEEDRLAREEEAKKHAFEMQASSIRRILKRKEADLVNCREIRLELDAAEKELREEKKKSHEAVMAALEVQKNQILGDNTPVKNEEEMDQRLNELKSGQILVDMAQEGAVKAGKVVDENRSRLEHCINKIKDGIKSDLKNRSIPDHIFEQIWKEEGAPIIFD